MRTYYRGRALRDRQGAALVEGILALFLVTVGTALGSLLLAKIGVVMNYRIKLSHVTTQAATYAASQAAPTEESLKPAVDLLLTKIGLPAAQKIKVDVDQANRIVVVSVTLRNLLLIGQGTVLPAFLSELTDSESAFQSQATAQADGWLSVIHHKNLGETRFWGHETVSLNANAPKPLGPHNVVIPVYVRNDAHTVEHVHIKEHDSQLP